MLFLLADHPSAIRVLLAVKLLAAGELWIDVTERQLARKLGVCERTVRRAKQRIREAGVPVELQWNRIGQSMASRWIIDRRRVDRLRVPKMSPQGDNCVPPYVDQNLLDGSSSHSKRPGRGREPPEWGVECDTTLDADSATLIVCEATPPGGAPPELTVAVDLLLEWLGDRCELRSDEGRVEALRLLPEAVQWLDRRLSQVGVPSLNVRMAAVWLRGSLLAELKAGGP